MLLGGWSIVNSHILWSAPNEGMKWPSATSAQLEHATCLPP